MTLDIHSDLKWRGLVQQATDDAGLPAWLAAEPRTIYVGFDPTADSLHVGSLMGLIVLRRFQRAGHRPIVLVGGATGMIGDPSGKSEERKLLSEDALRTNVEGMQAQMRNILDFDSGSNPARLVNNYDWMSKFGFLEFLRDVGKHFPVNVMLAKDSVKSRLERADIGLSYTEFSYMLLQAYDFVYLNEHFGCQLQGGGSDQWGNITAGIDLARRIRSLDSRDPPAASAQLYGLIWPLLTKSDGSKMGKTESGAVWLSAARTSPYQFYQYWVTVADADAGRCLRTLTELSHEEIKSLDATRVARPEARESQRRLAEELTRLVHGESGLAAARRATDIFFGAEIDQLSDAQLTEIFADVSSVTLPRSRIEAGGLNIVDAIVESGLAKSKGDARRTVEQGGAYINNRRVEAIDRTITAADLASETVVVLRSGKKKYALLRLTNG